MTYAVKHKGGLWDIAEDPQGEFETRAQAERWALDHIRRRDMAPGLWEALEAHRVSDPGVSPPEAP